MVDSTKGSVNVHSEPQANEVAQARNVYSKCN